MAELTPDTVVARGAEHVETRVGDQTMMMSIARGKYYALEATAQRIWELIETPRSLGEIADRLAQEYKVDSERCAAEVERFVARLMENGLAVRAGDAASR